MNESAVISTGRRRISAASRAASSRLAPSARRRLANSTIRIEFLEARPISVTRPIWQ
jgi:hypothetical protein